MFDEALKIMKLLDAAMDAYYGDLSVSVWYKQYHITIEVFRLFQERVGTKINVSEEAESIYTAENDNTGYWSKENKWLLRPSTISKIVEDALKICK